LQKQTKIHIKIVQFLIVCFQLSNFDYSKLLWNHHVFQWIIETYTLRLNVSHIFIGGGYIPSYEVSDPLEVFFEEDKEKNEKRKKKILGNMTLNNAWLFDGFAWRRIKKMNNKRQNFACSLVFNQDLSEVKELILNISVSKFCFIKMYILSKKKHKNLCHSKTNQKRRGKGVRSEKLWHKSAIKHEKEGPRLSQEPPSKEFGQNPKGPPSDFQLLCASMKSQDLSVSLIFLTDQHFGRRRLQWSLRGTWCRPPIRRTLQPEDQRVETGFGFTGSASQRKNGFAG